MAEKQLLIESCDFSFSIKEDNELKESLRLSAGKNDTLIVKGVPSTICNFKNQNGRVYPTALMQKAIEEAKPKMNRRELNSQACEHPEQSLVTPTNVSHTIINAYIKNVEVEVDGKKIRRDVLFTDWLVLPTRDGTTLITLLKNGVSVPVSIRGLGSCDENGMVDDYEFLGVDCVANASSKVHSTMYVSESVEVSAVPLTETYVVSASATNVVRDLDQALALSQQIDSANFGTVKKTSTKLDSEVDPKTGAETTMVTLETETEDEVSELDQALAMAKQAILNGKADIDSVTIENVKEEQPKESVENKDDEKALNEDGYIPESEMSDSTNTVSGEYKANQVGSPEKRAERAVQMQYNFIVGNTQEADPERQQAENIFAKFEQGQTSAIDTREALYNIASGLQKKLWGESKDTEYDVHEFTPKGVDWIYDSVISLMWNDGLTLEQACRKFCEQNDNIPYDYLLEYMRTAPVEESVITEAKEEKQEDPNSGKQYVLKTNQGFVAMDGNAISFVDSPKDAIHFVKGKEESGVIHLSGIEKILETMGILDTEKYFKKDTVDISAPDDVNVQAIGPDKIEEVDGNNLSGKMTEENGSNTRFKATVKINGANGESTEDVPVSAVDMEGINAEVTNLYDMKKQKADGELTITVTDTASGQQFMLNPETRQIEPMNVQIESAGDIKQDGNKLSMEVDDDNKVEKEFDTPAQASVAKAGIESGKLGGDVLLSEDDNPTSEVDDEEIPVKTDYSYESIEPGWYASAPSIGFVGPYNTEDELRSVLGKEVCEIADSNKGLVNIDYVEDNDALAAESTKIDEVMFNEPGEASDPFVEKPLKDSVGNVIVEVDNIDWDNEDLYSNFLANYEPGDPVIFNDIESKVKDLPSSALVKINMDELPDDIDLHTLKNCVLDSLRKTYAMKANNADIISINYIN